MLNKLKTNKNTNIFKKTVKYIFLIILVFLVFLVFLVILLILISLVLINTKKPSNDRNWELGQQVLQFVEINNTAINSSIKFNNYKNTKNKKDKKNKEYKKEKIKEELKEKRKIKNIKIKSLRNYNWTNIGKEEKYEDISFNLSDIIGLKVGVSHFSVKESIAHIFLVFNLKNNKDIALSIEARRDNGEDFNLLGGIKFDYELIYVLASLEDLVSLRKKRNEEVYIYPIKISESKAQELFLLLSKKVNSLYYKPEFYHLIFKNCTNLVVDKVNIISDKKFPIYEQTLAPGYAGKALFKMGLIDTDLKTFKEVKDKFLVTF